MLLHGLGRRHDGRTLLGTYPFAFIGFHGIHCVSTSGRQNKTLVSIFSKSFNHSLWQLQLVLVVQ